MKPKFHRVLLKLSGEVLAGDNQAISFSSLAQITASCRILKNAGHEIGIVIGGGNIFRGGRQKFLNRAAADRVGMLATLVNALTLKISLEQSGIAAAFLSVPEIRGISELANEENARRILQEDKIVVYGGGTGLPFLTTDTAAVIRALEIGADILLKATQVDGIYDSDPNLNKNAKKYKHLDFAEALEKKLAIMDMSAFALCQEYNLPVMVFKFCRESFSRLARGKISGTLVSK